MSDIEERQNKKKDIDINAIVEKRQKMLDAMPEELINELLENARKLEELQKILDNTSGKKERDKLLLEMEKISIVQDKAIREKYKPTS